MILASTVALAAINAAESLILKYIFDALTPGHSKRILVVGMGLLAALGLARETATGCSNWLTWRTRLAIHYSLLEATVERLHRLPLSFHRAEGVGAIMTRLDRSIQGFIGAVSQILFNVCFVPFPAVIAAWSGPEQTRRERGLLEQWSKI